LYFNIKVRSFEQKLFNEIYLTTDFSTKKGKLMKIKHRSTSLEPKRTTSLLSSPPIYENTKLEKIINQNKNESCLDLRGEKLINADMEIVGYCLLRNNQVSNVILLLKRRDEFQYNHVNS
jgi:hypothetical protein